MHSPQDGEDRREVHNFSSEYVSPSQAASFSSRGQHGIFGGTMVLAPYLLIAGFKANGDIKEILMGKTRANC